MSQDSVTMTEDYGIWWSYVHHFIDYPGYVYAYAFGELLVLALYAKYENAGRLRGQVPRMLTAGGSTGRTRSSARWASTCATRTSGRTGWTSSTGWSARRSLADEVGQ